MHETEQTQAPHVRVGNRASVGGPWVRAGAGAGVRMQASV